MVGSLGKKEQKETTFSEIPKLLQENSNYFPHPNSPPESVQAEVVTEKLTEIEELTEEEQSDRLHLERKVERAFYEAGRALRELRDRRLYRNTHKTFENYVKDRFGFGRITAHYKIAGY